MGRLPMLQPVDTAGSCAELRDACSVQMSVQRVCTHTWYLDHGIQPLANTDMGLLPAPLGVLPLPCTTCPGENFFLVSKLRLEAAAPCAQSLWHAPPGHPAQIPCSLPFPLKPPRTPCLQCSWQGTIGPCSGSRNSAGVPGGAEPQGAAAGVRRSPRGAARCERNGLIGKWPGRHTALTFR